MARIAGWNPDPPVCGDSNLDGVVGMDDAVFLVNYIFKAGAAPSEMNLSDVNNDSRVNVGDVVYLVQNLFATGPAVNCPE